MILDFNYKYPFCVIISCYEPAKPPDRLSEFIFYVRLILFLHLLRTNKHKISYVKLKWNALLKKYKLQFLHKSEF